MCGMRCCILSQRVEVMSRYRLGPLRIGFFYGALAVVVALAADLRYLFIDPQEIPHWILTAIEEFRTQLALTVTLFLGILAAIRTRPTRVDPDVPYRSVLLRDCVLAATVVAVMAGGVLFVGTALKPPVFAGAKSVFARGPRPRIVSYQEEGGRGLGHPSPPPARGEIQEDPP